MRLSFFKKEFYEFFKTYRFYVLFGVFTFFAVLNAPIAKYLPQMMQALPDVGINIEMPDPVMADSYVQFISNSTNAFFALIIIYMGSISTEIKKGTILLVLSKGVPRLDFFFSKYLNGLIMYTFSYAMYTLISIAGTWVFFGQWYFSELFASIISIYIFGLILMTAAFSASAVAKSAGPGAFAGFGLLILLPLTDFFGKAAKYLPGHLMTLPEKYLNQTASTGDLIWPAVTSIIIISLMLIASMVRFRKREL
ncbi:MAG: ABC transporter permease subunit [Clostridiales bacterium]|nr:ABC transporter permease subunit [Clostridiales bacterium]